MSPGGLLELVLCASMVPGWLAFAMPGEQACRQGSRALCSRLLYQSNPFEGANLTFLIVVPVLDRWQSSGRVRGRCALGNLLGGV